MNARVESVKGLCFRGLLTTSGIGKFDGKLYNGGGDDDIKTYKLITGNGDIKL